MMFFNICKTYNFVVKNFKDSINILDPGFVKDKLNTMVL